MAYRSFFALFALFSLTIKSTGYAADPMRVEVFTAFSCADYQTLYSLGEELRAEFGKKIRLEHRASSAFAGPTDSANFKATFTHKSYLIHLAMECAKSQGKKRELMKAAYEKCNVDKKVRPIEPLECVIELAQLTVKDRAKFDQCLDPARKRLDTGKVERARTAEASAVDQALEEAGRYQEKVNSCAFIVVGGDEFFVLPTITEEARPGASAFSPEVLTEFKSKIRESIKTRLSQ